MKGDGPTLLGRDWLTELTLNVDWSSLHCVQVRKSLTKVLDKYSAVFNNELGEAKDFVATLQVDPTVEPKFYKARPVSFAMKQKVEAELDGLLVTGVIEPVKYSNWAVPVVPVMKQDGSIRLCGDFKLTLNKAARPDIYPLPHIDELFATLGEEKPFLSWTYQQLLLAEESRVYTTINTHKGLFRFTRLPFGASAAPAIFQRVMETLLKGIPNVSVYLDDILLSGNSDKAHLDNLEAVLAQLGAAGFRLKQSKCMFFLPEVEYLGHRITADGLHPTTSKVKAISAAPPPKNVAQLKAFLGLVNYYAKFLKNMASILAPLYKLLHKNVKWTWGKEQQSGFEQIKEQLKSDAVLVHYDPTKMLILSCDASPYGLGAVLAHRLQDESERPIAFASRTVSPTEKRYAQLDKEGLAIIFGLKKFHQYLLGQHFIVYSDHKPLTHIFNPSRATPVIASGRIQRWALTIGMCDYEIQYKPGCSKLMLMHAVVYHYQTLRQVFPFRETQFF